MLVQGFDGRNVSIALDGIELKAVCLMLERAESAQFQQTAYALNLDGFKLSASDVAAYTRHFQLVVKDVLAKVVNKPDSEENHKETVQ